MTVWAVLNKGLVRAHQRTAAGRRVQVRQYQTKRTKQEQSPQRHRLSTVREEMLTRPAIDVNRSKVDTEDIATWEEGEVEGYGLKSYVVGRQASSWERAGAQQSAKYAVRLALAWMGAAHRLPALKLDFVYPVEDVPEEQAAGANAAYLPTVRCIMLFRGKQSLLHEMGHAIDHQVFGAGQGESSEFAEFYGSKADDPRLRPVLDAIDQSNAALRLGEQQGSWVEVARDPTDRFARAYEQWVLQKARRMRGQPRVAKQAEEILWSRVWSEGMLRRGVYWEPADFEEIGRQMDLLFAGAGMRKAILCLLRGRRRRQFSS